MFSLIGRYLAASFIVPFFVSLIFFVSFLLTTQLFRITSIVTKKDVSLLTVFELIGHIGISFLPMALPLSTLFAVIYTLNKLSEDSEIVAMRSFGLTKSKLYAPFLIVSLMIGAMAYSLGEKAIPYSKTRFKNTIVKLTSRGMLTNIRPGQFFTEIPDITLFAEDVSKDGNELHNIFIQTSGDGRGDERIIMAREGHLIKQSTGEWDAPTLRLHLKDGNLMTIKSPTETEKIIFREYDFPVLSGGAITNFVTKDSMRTNVELTKAIEEFRREQGALKDKSDPKSLERKDWLLKRVAMARLEYWERFNNPLQVLIFMFLGFSLGVKKGRGRGKNTSVVGIIVLIIYYSIYFTGVSVAQKGILSPLFVVFFPCLISLLAGFYYFRKFDWAS